MFHMNKNKNITDSSENEKKNEMKKKNEKEKNEKNEMKIIEISN